MKMLLLDDHPLVRSALESVIQSMGRQVTLVTAATAAQAQSRLADGGSIDLALLDLQLPDGDGFSLLADWRGRYPEMRVVIISASEQPGEIMRALEEGAAGFIPKRTAIEVLVHALRMVMSGGIYVPPLALKTGVAAAGPAPSRDMSSPIKVHEPAAVQGADHGLHAAWWPGGMAIEPTAAASGRGRLGIGTLPHLKLTPRQSDVLGLLLQGQPNKLIARQLNLSVETVKDHVASLLRVLGVSSRTQAVLAVSQMMTIPASPAHSMMRAPSAPALHRPV
ncbi:MAG: DNA-binding response regulator [Betaproteobacteria bacterium]|nr:DNA-binding response regulator [Betaproteobacteria bacterium]